MILHHLLTIQTRQKIKHRVNNLYFLFITDRSKPTNKSVFLSLRHNEISASKTVLNIQNKLYTYIWNVLCILTQILLRLSVYCFVRLVCTYNDFLVCQVSFSEREKL